MSACKNSTVEWKEVQHTHEVLAFGEMRSGIGLSLDIQGYFVCILLCSFTETRLAANTASLGCLTAVPADEWGLC